MEEIDGFEPSNNGREDEEWRRDVIKVIFFGAALAIIGIISCIFYVPH